MENLTNYLPTIIVIVVIIAILYKFNLLSTNSERFSSSGLAISNDYCGQLTDVYAYPHNTHPIVRGDLRRRICGPVRRDIVDKQTGNYLTINRQLV